MGNRKWITGLEDGNAVVLVMFVLSILTVMGFAAMNTSTTELMVAGNDLIYRKNFYDAEGEVVKILHSIETADSQTLKTWELEDLYPYTTIDSDPDIAIKIKRDLKNWTPTFDFKPNGIAVDMGIAHGSSMVMTNASHVRSYAAFGHYQASNGKILIESGYKKRF